MKKTVEMYTDGACRGNPGPGGWGVVLIYGKVNKDLNGYEPMTTNNRMELMAAISGLAQLKESCQVCLWTDSQYVQKGICEWLLKWKKNNWLTADKKPVKNKELWEQLDALIQKHEVEWKWVKGHSGNFYNERADELARAAIDLGLQGNL